MKMSFRLQGGFAAVNLLLAGCGQAPETAQRQTPAPGKPVPVAARTPSKAELDASLLRAQARGILALARAITFLESQTNELAAQRQIVEVLSKAGARP